MSDSKAEPEPLTAGYDGWAVIDLYAQTIVQINASASQVLGPRADKLPAGLAHFVTSTDLELLTDTVLPRVRSGNTWAGGIRLGDQRLDTGPTPTMVVPHVSTGTDHPDYASLLFALPGAPDTVDVVSDSLTGMPTRSALFQRLERAVRTNRVNASLLVALFIDLDGLKAINDRHGHEVGDTALIETAQRIATKVPPGALAVRFGGDEFVVIYEDAVDLDEAEELAEEILAALHETGDHHAISASIGIAVSRSGEADSHELIRRADTAMYRAKARGGGQLAIFDAEMRTKQRDDEAMRSSVLQAIASNGLGIAAQPIFELATGSIYGVELFVQLQDHGPFVDDANQLFRLAHEHSEAFDAAVLDRAVRLSRRWNAALGDQAPRIQLNVSTQSLAATAFVQRVTNAINHNDLAPGSIAFEVDGNDLITGGERERSMLNELRAVGANIVIDGFGEGPITVPALAEWKPTMVKIDASSFAPDVLTGLLRAVSTLRIATCVKGIANQDELRHAVRVGAFTGQGNALTPVRYIEGINAQLHGRTRLGF